MMYGSTKRKHSLSQRLFEAQNHRCAYCHKDIELTLDHVIPKTYNGTNSQENLVGACARCNRLKSNMHGPLFYELLHRIEDVSKRERKIIRSVYGSNVMHFLSKVNNIRRTEKLHLVKT